MKRRRHPPDPPKPLVRIDLHSHTTQSDGELSPTSLLARAARVGVTHLAVSDHDTVAAIPEATEQATKLGVKIVPGIEISARLNGRECHILGHHFTRMDALSAWCDERKAERRERLVRMIARLADSGVRIDLAELEREAAGGTLGRPHLARALIKGGHAASIQEAFTRYLAPGAGAFIERPAPESKDVIALVRAAGGTTSVAHPGVNKITQVEIRQLADMGLDAVEANHPDHSRQRVGEFTKWARDARMRVTGGSDFHAGEFSAELGSATTSLEDYDALAAIAEQRRG